ncbi:RtcB family protein [Desulfobotulus sp.]|jgi:tRNA-splicing ligase RtcB|uniref:RtcB family protein n=1 Tax=Desulfobotulus sp. TaxID=1940337 RepID=UPI002A36ADE0|nr:RtcB family protein [Desulfobotulus sp.]MDY0161808.1 RtcB family protein [Desulfobotulus sp.]
MKPKENGIPILSWCPDPDPLAMAQAENLSRHPRVMGHIALMPDCHAGYGMPIGGVVAVRNALIPNAVGVDIGCGMCALATDFQEIPEKKTLETITRLLFSRIPTGFDRHRMAQRWKGMEDYAQALSRTPGWMKKDTLHIAAQSLGTLGGGNHFIEIQCDTQNRIWAMIHSGSRNLGKTIAEFYHHQALRENQREKILLPSEDLAFLDADTAKGRDYIRDMTFALDFARENRKRMMLVVKEVLGEVLGCGFGEEVNIHHNYAAKERHLGAEVWIHRKGATSARQGEKGIIPGSMGTSSYIVEGLGNPDAFFSCSHGAGRTMGRNEACRMLSPEAVADSMRGIVHAPFPRIQKGSLRGRTDFGEAPGAYKDIDLVMEQQRDLIRILVRLRPLAVVKG